MECDQNNLIVSDKFGIIIPFSAAYLQEWVLFKLATKDCFRGKKKLNLAFLRLFFKVKTVECDQKVLSFSDESQMLIPFSAIYFLEVSARVSLKVATKSSFTGKKSPKFIIF